ncbi:hypothetical protein T4C_9596 [Trichinella pseudospiralis]|uniref:Uncharacterized protein n=2 Tax=Trichinella pseudospiralis TaxID=6337 RepID=A0A0V1IEC2_TRIPS|nr:hypothetical protein T4C_9596 [Trichinella pseudospiralis]
MLFMTLQHYAKTSENSILRLKRKYLHPGDSNGSHVQFCMFQRYSTHKFCYIQQSLLSILEQQTRCESNRPIRDKQALYPWLNVISVVCGWRWRCVIEVQEEKTVYR